ncbi:hypothetical protein [Emergencia sp.]|uniref:hypothetical protein n=1 Tax=Emergencia sp. TaxID=1926557 RepID=UPI003AEF99E0
MKERIEELEKIFEAANERFLINNTMLFETRVSERTFCGALMMELKNIIASTKFSDYYVDVEYNRNIGGKVKTIKKTIKGLDQQIVTINCDLIVHSRGLNMCHDNLIALEMKKSTGRKCDKENDRIRLECLTKSPDQEVWSYDGKTLPEYVCGYDLGIYYEINFNRNTILIEYYQKGECYRQYKCCISK